MRSFIIMRSICAAQKMVPRLRRKGGAFYRRHDRGPAAHMDRPGILAVEDPMDPSNDLAKGSYNAHKVRHTSSLDLPVPQRPFALATPWLLDGVYCWTVTVHES